MTNPWPTRARTSFTGYSEVMDLLARFASLLSTSSPSGRPGVEAPGVEAPNGNGGGLAGGGGGKAPGVESPGVEAPGVEAWPIVLPSCPISAQSE